MSRRFSTAAVSRRATLTYPSGSSRGVWNAASKGNWPVIARVLRLIIPLDISGWVLHCIRRSSAMASSEQLSTTLVDAVRG